MTTDIGALQREYACLRQKRNRMQVIVNDAQYIYPGPTSALSQGTKQPEVPNISMTTNNSEPITIKTVTMENKQSYIDFLDSITPQFIGGTKCFMVQTDQKQNNKRCRRRSAGDTCTQPSYNIPDCRNFGDIGSHANTALNSSTNTSDGIQDFQKPNDKSNQSEDKFQDDINDLLNAIEALHKDVYVALKDRKVAADKSSTNKDASNAVLNERGGNSKGKRLKKMCTCAGKEPLIDISKEKHKTEKATAQYEQNGKKCVQNINETDERVDEPLHDSNAALERKMCARTSKEKNKAEDTGGSNRTTTSARKIGHQGVQSKSTKKYVELFLDDDISEVTNEITENNPDKSNEDSVISDADNVIQEADLCAQNEVSNGGSDETEENVKSIHDGATTQADHNADKPKTDISDNGSTGINERTVEVESEINETTDIKPKTNDNSDDPAILPVTLTTYSYRRRGSNGLAGRSVSLNIDQTSDNQSTVSSDVKANIYHNFYTKKRHLSVDSASALKEDPNSANGKVLNPFPVQHKNRNRIKLGVKLGLYMDKRP